jgi:hypothetical protein
MITPRTLSRFLPAAAAAVLLCLIAAENCTAQIKVDLSFKRKLYVLYEPVVAIVSIENLSGRPLLLDNSGENRWFGFTIETEDGRPVPPVNPDYALEPVAIEPGERLTRAVNLTPLFPMQDFGSYRVKATIYAPSFSRFFSSAPLAIEITDGRPIWQEVVGVPGASGPPELRTVTLLTHKLSRSTRLYARIEDKERGKIYATHQLGPYLTFGRPDVVLDLRNEIHVLQNSAPKQFLYTHLGLSGEILGQQAYLEAGSRPQLTKDAHGEVQVIGGRPYKAGEEEEAAAAADKVGDRPVPLPGS